ncbi:hypothetical protein F8A10_20140 (plasmid) [Paracoccus kondratievae]|uniref:Uncharacterized protein n=1 Tax=Paracoccus kondratievae TaxID=135740 RepID=A0AAD3RUT7_9RHOB|nr:MULTISPECIES: hypothetical protein [Paracoccus]QFQ86810.1 hypothetical protein F8A10_04830 [Paracoccus kondratievae]QFQ89746.1 hypothetical protein F8A10_20140 [Paracoccus kondratievae]SMG23269.1 hypothetical protein SAMN02746000_01313 [Paracoccus sp. J56]SMG30474.1 hypothetical protein SAMN02746000_01812 [Paracoccus sp. J56]GLK65177.1 hypothetical protein GCM10017635_26510 [Paracoccus kondratievae]
MNKFLPVLALGLLAACSIDPKDYETAPVTVQTASGPVTCQLYTRSLVTWDRSIDRPANMTVAAADQICLSEGQRQKAAGTSPAGASEPDLSL